MGELCAAGQGAARRVAHQVAVGLLVESLALARPVVELHLEQRVLVALHLELDGAVDVVLALQPLLALLDLGDQLVPVGQFLAALPERFGVPPDLGLVLPVNLLRQRCDVRPAVLLVGADERLEIAPAPLGEASFQQ